jgi:hypothetical protein
MKGENKMKIVILCLIILGCLLALGCVDSNGLPGKVLTTPEGIRYKIVEIEGHRFIATPSYMGYWTLAGPIE